VARFRVNIFKQRGSCATVMRVVPTNPGLDELHLHGGLKESVESAERRCACTGQKGPGNSSTIAAILDKMNKRRPTTSSIEDPRVSS